jgi:hypothetical protein
LGIPDDLHFSKVILVIHHRHHAAVLFLKAYTRLKFHTNGLMALICVVMVLLNCAPTDTGDFPCDSPMFEMLEFRVRKWGRMGR